MSSNVVHGNKGGSWGGGNSFPTPPAPQTPIVQIVDNLSQVPKETKFTSFTYEGWSIRFQEQEPFAWYIHHECDGKRYLAVDDENMGIHYAGDRMTHIGVDDKLQQTGGFGHPELLTGIKCYNCKVAIPKYSYLILRRTQKFLLMGKTKSKYK